MVKKIYLLGKSITEGTGIRAVKLATLGLAMNFLGACNPLGEENGEEIICKVYDEKTGECLYFGSKSDPYVPHFPTIEDLNGNLNGIASGSLPFTFTNDEVVDIMCEQVSEFENSDINECKDKYNEYAEKCNRTGFLTAIERDYRLMECEKQYQEDIKNPENLEPPYNGWPITKAQYSYNKSVDYLTSKNEIIMRNCNDIPKQEIIYKE